MCVIIALAMSEEMSMWCFYCQSGDTSGVVFKNGFAWIHQTCFEELLDNANSVEQILKIVNGEKPDDSITKFIERMEDFKRRWGNSMKFVEEVSKK